MTLKYFNFIKKWKGSQLLLTELYFRMIALILIFNSSHSARIFKSAQQHNPDKNTKYTTSVSL